MSGTHLTVTIVGSDEARGVVRFDEFFRFCETVYKCLRLSEQIVSGEAASIEYRVTGLKIGSATIQLEAVRKGKREDRRSKVLSYFRKTVSNLQHGKIDPRMRPEDLGTFRELAEPLADIDALVKDIEAKRAILVVSVNTYTEMRRAKHTPRQAEAFDSFLKRQSIIRVYVSFPIAQKAEEIRSPDEPFVSQGFFLCQGSPHRSSSDRVTAGRPLLPNPGARQVSPRLHSESPAKPAPVSG